MKGCRKIHSQFSEALYDELEPSRMHQFQAHLEQCAACRNAFNEMKSVLTMMSAKKNIKPEPAFWNGFWDRLVNRMKQNRPSVQKGSYFLSRLFKVSPFLPGWGPRLAQAVAMIAIGIFIGYLFFGQPWRKGRISDNLPEKSAPIRQAAIDQQALEYLERSKVLLLGLVNLDTDQVDLSSMDFSRQKEISRELIQEANVFQKQLKGTEYRRLLALTGELEMIMMQICNYQETFDLPAIELIKSGVENQAILLKINLTEMMLSAQIDQTKSKKL